MTDEKILNEEKKEETMETVESEMSEAENEKVENNEVKNDNVSEEHDESENTELDAEENPEEDHLPDQNIVYLRGMIRAIRQELDENNVEQNVLTVTTTQPTREGGLKSERVDVIWGSNTRAEGLISEYKTGDHVEVYAEYRTYINTSTQQRGSNFYGLRIQKSKPSGITGLSYDPDKNEGFFIGTIRRINMIRPNFAIISLVVQTKSRKRRVNCYPAIGVGGFVCNVLRRNEKYFQPGMKMGVGCQINIRFNPQTEMKEILWNATSLFYFNEEGERVALQIPVRSFYHAPRNNANRERRPQVVSSSAAEDLRNTRPTSTEESAEEVEPSVPAETLEAKPAEENPEVIEFERKKGGKTRAKVLSEDEVKNSIQDQLMNGFDDDTD